MFKTKRKPMARLMAAAGLIAASTVAVGCESQKTQIEKALGVPVEMSEEASEDRCVRYNLQELLDAFEELPREAQVELRNKVMSKADKVVIERSRIASELHGRAIGKAIRTLRHGGLNVSSLDYVEAKQLLFKEIQKSGNDPSSFLSLEDRTLRLQPEYEKDRIKYTYYEFHRWIGVGYAGDPKVYERYYAADTVEKAQATADGMRQYDPYDTCGTMRNSLMEVLN